MSTGNHKKPSGVVTRTHPCSTNTHRSPPPSAVAPDGADVDARSSPHGAFGSAPRDRSPALYHGLAGGARLAEGKLHALHGSTRHANWSPQAWEAYPPCPRAGEQHQ